MTTQQGQSVSTIDKERQIGAMLMINMKIVNARCAGETYRHFDLNAGSGWNHEFGGDIGVPGTPLVFLELAEQYLSRWEAVFFEVDYKRATELEQRLRGIPHCRVEAADNQTFLNLARHLRKPVGSVLVDPNGYLYRRVNGIGCPIPQMVEFFHWFPRMDLLANVNVRVYKQMRGAETYEWEGKRKPIYKGLHPLHKFREVFGKRYGLISNLDHNGHSAFVRIVLRNLYTNDWRAMGWNQWNSPAAREIYRWTETTREERCIDNDLGQLALGFEGETI